MEEKELEESSAPAVACGFIPLTICPIEEEEESKHNPAPLFRNYNLNNVNCFRKEVNLTSQNDETILTSNWIPR